MMGSSEPSTGSRRNAPNTPVASQVIYGVEDGWQGVRECSLAAAREDWGVVVLIRGALAPEVLALITVPPQMRVVAVSDSSFRLRLVWEMIRAASRGQLQWVVVTKARTRQLLAPVARACRVQVLRLRELDEGYALDGDVPARERPAWLKGTANGHP